MIYGALANNAPGDKKMMEPANLKKASGASCPDLKTIRVLYRGNCAMQENVSHKMCSWYCDPIATCD